MLFERTVPQRGEDEDVPLFGVIQVPPEVGDERAVSVKAGHVTATVKLRRRRALDMNPSSCGRSARIVRFFLGILMHRVSRDNSWSYSVVAGCKYFTCLNEYVD